MSKELKNKGYKDYLRKPIQPAVIIGFILFVTLVILVAAYFTTPKRSVASFCSTYRGEKARLAKLPGNTYPSSVFNDALSDAGEFATSFGKLEKVAPDDIKPDTKTLRSVYQKIDDDPSQAINASLSGVLADSSVRQWTTDHCKE